MLFLTVPGVANTTTWRVDLLPALALKIDAFSPVSKYFSWFCLTSVADGDLLGTETLAGLPVADTTGTRTSAVTQNVVKRIGYKGNKRYVQCSLASETVTAATIVAITALLHSPTLAPIANP